MWRKPIAQGLMRKLGDDQTLQLIFEPDYDIADTIIRSSGAHLALIEVAESGDNDTSRCLALCVRLRRETPECKLLLMCPEKDRFSVAHAVNAKRDRLIDDFVFYDSSADYLASKLMSL